MSKADEIFDLEGFNKTYYTRQGTLTTKEIAEVIVYEYYNLENKLETQIEFYIFDEEMGIQGLITKHLWKAINLKVKELRLDRRRR